MKTSQIENVHICTLFSLNYFSRGIAMLESLEKYTKVNYQVHILALDEKTFELLMNRKKTNWKVYTVYELHDTDFLNLLGQRPHKEYCWTAASVFIKFLMEFVDFWDCLLYVDADCFFFDDFKLIMNSWYKDRNILVHEHRFISELRYKISTSGKFNVGIIGFRNSIESRSCVERWRKQCINECVLDPKRGLCGDQTYLDEWPELYGTLQAMSSLGMGTAPWNLSQYRIDYRAGKVLIEQDSLVFYHFHSFELIYWFRLPLLLMRPASPNYVLPALALKYIYKPYFFKINSSSRYLRKLGLKLEEIGVKEVTLQTFIKSLKLTIIDS